MDATITIQENGKPVSFTVRNIPEGATDDQIKAFGQRELAKQRPSNNYAEPLLKKYGAVDEAIHSATLGADTYAHGLAGAALNAIDAPLRSDVDFDPIGAFEATRKGSLDASANYERNNFWASKVAGLGGFLLGAPGQAAGAIAREAAPLLTRIGHGALSGGILGSIAGFNNTRDSVAEDPTGNAGNSGFGGLIGATIGSALPIAGRIASPIVDPIMNYIRGGSGLAAQRVAEAIQNDGTTPAAAGAVMDQARALGVPRALADNGENTAGLANAIARVPGGPRTAMSDFLRERQRGQGQRLQGAITRDLGPVGNVAEQSDALIQQARARAAPLYDQAYTAGGQSSPEIAAILNTPAGRSALGRARTIAANERRDPNSLGFDLNDQGETVLTGVPSIQTLDYVKRGLDDLLEPNRNPVTGRLVLDESGRAINQVKNQLLSEMDRLNPAYGQARAAYAGPARESEALKLGQSMVDASESDIERATSRMSQGEREQFALGMRSKLSDRLNKRTDLGNKVDYLSNTPDRRNVLQTVAGPTANYDRFEQTLGHEGALQDTYSTAMTGSRTLNNLADAELMGDAGLPQNVLGRFARGTRQGGFWGGVTNAAAPLLDASRFGTGQTGNRVRDEIAALLTETDPRVFQTALESARRDALRRQVIAGRLGLNTSNTLGALAGQSVAKVRQ